jgi:hypothetical protein
MLEHSLHFAFSFLGFHDKFFFIETHVLELNFAVSFFLQEFSVLFFETIESFIENLSSFVHFFHDGFAVVFDHGISVGVSSIKATFLHLKSRIFGIL